ncbi:hypothetical protein ACIHCX_03120 [Streptomyces sp. NPDC052043]|uniref:hypothetical protein n=1 Tax=Streptomyces sp. NPDC052043 TaxID=3365684 RepID=UPI0037D869CF
MSTESTTKPTTPLAFVDTETTGLDPRKHDAWEIAVILRRPGIADTEHLFQLRTSLSTADLKALEIGRHAERFAVPNGEFAIQLPTATTPGPATLTEADLMHELLALLDGAMLIGSNPAFDDRFLTKLFNEAGLPTRWHYRTIDIATLAAGYRHGQAASGAYGGDFLFPGDYPQLPYKSYELSRAVGVEPPAKDVAHTALGDARWARDVYDAVTGGAK